MFFPTNSKNLLIYSPLIFIFIYMEAFTNILEWLNLLVLAFALVLSLVVRKHQDLLLIQFYIIISLGLNIWLKIAEHLPNDIQYKYISGFVVNIYSIIEFSLIYLFLFRLITRGEFRISMRLFYIFYVSLNTAVWMAYKRSIFRPISHLYGLESILITIACLFYFLEILKSDRIIDFKSNSEFIVVCGLLFYFSISVPFFFSVSSTYKFKLFDIIASFNTLFYILMFVSFLKAYLCPLAEQKN